MLTNIVYLGLFWSNYSVAVSSLIPRNQSSGGTLTPGVAIYAYSIYDSNYRPTPIRAMPNFDQPTVTRRL